MNLRHVTQPFQYQGSKRLIAHEILLNLSMPRDSVLVEPFAGSAAVSVRAAMERRARSFWINDANEPLINLWRAIVEDPIGLTDKYSSLWHAQKSDPKRFYSDIRDRFNEQHQPADLLYLLARAVKGAVRYNSAGHFNQSPDNRRLGTHPMKFRERFSRISQAFGNRVTISSLDYREMLTRYQPDQVWYMDPPYQGVSSVRNSRYSSGVDREEFERFLGRLVDGNIPFALSYDGQTGNKTYGPPLPAELGLKRVELDAGRSTTSTLLGRMERTTEVLYLSPNLQTMSASKRELGQLVMSFL